MHGMRARAAFWALATLSGPVSFSFLFLLLLITSATPKLVHAQVDGFVRIDCGASKENFSGNISWTTDSNYTSQGLNGKTEVVALPPYDTLRFFPDKAVTKSCYVFNTIANFSYLIRAGFLYGNYDNRSASEGLPSFVLLFGANVWTNVEFNNDSEVVTHEMIALATSDTASVCVGRSSTIVHNPFISSLEIRSLSSNQMYSPVRQNFLMQTNSRINFGQKDNSSVRFPDDAYDRIWDSDSKVITNIAVYDTILTTNNTVSVTRTDDLPPIEVMQTARSLNKTENMSFTFMAKYGPGQYYLSFYFAELDNSTSQQQIMDVYIDRDLRNRAVNVFDIRGIYNTLQLSDKNYTVTDKNFTLLLMPNENSTRAPYINAAESYFLQRMDHLTFDQDVQALETIKSSLNLSNWLGDPCLPVAYKWSWLDCDNNSSQTRVISLNLSSMNLRSEIPPALADLSALTSVDLHNNSLYGSIPASLANLGNLTFLDLSFNNLSGYPPELNNATDFRIAGNAFICVNNSCIVAPAPVPGLVQPARSDSGDPRGLIVGLVVAAIFVFAATGLGCMLYKRKSQKKKGFFVAHSAHWPPVPPFAVMSKSVDYGIAAHTGGSDDVPVFSFAYMQNITNNFENKIAAEGCNDALYYGTLSDGQEVVVKFLNGTIKQTPMEFLYKVTPLAGVHHKNLLRPIGFCAENQHFMFMYERDQKGSLYDYLHNTDKHALDWRTRLSILLQVAQGLEHLHTSCSPGIIHGNLKSANVLFSSDGLLAKVSEFGIYELSSADVDATSGYLDPEYFAMNKLTDKSDIYSFGVLILEVVCGRMPLDRRLPKDAWNIIEWAGKMYSGGEHELIADASLQGTYNKATLSKVVKLALQATDRNVDGRPNIVELVMELKEANKTAVGHHVVFAVLDDSNSSNDLEAPLSL